MPANLIVFEGRTQKSQKEFEAQVRDIIYNKIGLCDSVKETPQFTLLISILRRHPDATAKLQKMIDLKVQANQMNRSGYEVIIMNDDGSETDISFRLAITGKHKTQKAELTSAMRSAIDEQVQIFRENSRQVCEFNPSHDTANLHVDHINHFEEIMANFLKEMKSKGIESPSDFGDTTDRTNRRAFREGDVTFENEWLKQHKKHANLRMLCHDCNMRRTKWKPGKSEAIAILED